MHNTLIRAATSAHKPLIRFVGQRSKLWGLERHDIGRHPAAPKNIVKAISSVPPTSKYNSFREPSDISQLPARYKRLPLSESEIEAIELGGASKVF